MTLVWSRAPYNGSTLLILLALADWANDEGVAWPAMDRLAKKARIDKRSARRVIRRLEKEGILVIEEGGGRSKQNRYFIQLKRVANCPPLRELNEDNEGAERGTSDAQKRVPVSSDPLVDPSLDSLVARRAKNIKQMSRAEFVSYLKAKPEFSHINIDREIQRATTWIENHPGRQLTKPFIINWLNKIDVPISNGNGAKLTTKQDLKRMLGEG